MACSTTTSSNTGKAADQSIHTISEKNALYLITNLLHDRVDDCLDVIQDAETCSKLESFFGAIHLPTLHTRSLLEIFLERAIETAKQNCNVDIDETLREEFLTYILPHLQTEEMQTHLDHLHADVINIALSEMEHWENENLFQNVIKTFNEQFNECEEERATLCNLNVAVRGMTSPEKIAKLLESEEKKIVALNREIEDVQDALRDLQLMQSAERLLKAQLNHKLLSGMMPFLVLNLSFDLVEISFLREGCHYLQDIAPQTTYRWIRSLDGPHEGKWKLQDETDEADGSLKKLFSHVYFSLYHN